MHPTASGEKKSKRKHQNAQKTQKRGQTREKTHEAHDKGRRTAGGRTRGPTAEPAQRGPATKTTPGRSGAQAAWPRRAWRSRTSHTTSGPGGDASPLRAAPSARRTRQPSPARRRWRRPVEDPCRRKNRPNLWSLPKCHERAKRQQTHARTVAKRKKVKKNQNRCQRDQLPVKLRITIKTYILLEKH